MKKIFIVAITLLALNSCRDRSINQNKELRIKIEQRVFIDGYNFYIFKVDNVEYITSDHGGIYPLIKNK